MAAIESLLMALAPQTPPLNGGLLGPQMTPSAPPPMAGPQAAPMPQIVAPPQPKSILDKVRELFSQSAPQGYEGLLTPEQIQAARPSFMSRLASITPGAPTPGEQYMGNLNNVVKMKMLATQAAETARIRNVRQNIEARFPLPPNPTPDQIRNNLAQRYDAYIGAGDADMAKEIGSSLRGIMAVPKDEPFKTAPAGSAIYDPKTGKVISTVGPSDKQYEPKPFTAANGDTIWVKPGDPVPPGAKPLSMAQTEIRVQSGEKRADQQQINQGITRFDRNTKDLKDRSRVIDQALVTLDDAAHNPDPAVRKSLYTSAVANFIQAADQKAQIRYQLLQYFKNNVDPSIAGKWEVLKARLLQGTLPQYSLEAMLKHLNNIKGLVQDEFNAQRSGEIKRHPELDGELPDVSEYFPLTSMRGAPSAGSAATAKPGAAVNPYPKK